MQVEIVEVIRRSEQGMTQPFICRGDDDAVYYVKGIDAGRDSQIKEWLAGCLGLHLGLPLAPFEIVNVPVELSESDPRDLGKLGAGFAFGSRARDGVMELTSSLVGEVPFDLQEDVVTFDWWIQNGDRLLTERGGNPNLFWDPGAEELLVIDHNQAFDDHFDPEVFRECHVFASAARRVAQDLYKRQEYESRLAGALAHWDEAVQQIPSEWFYSDSEMTVPVAFDLDSVRSMLGRYQVEGFWNTL